MEGSNTLEENKKESDEIPTPLNQWHKKNLSLKNKPIRGVTDTNLKKAVQFIANDQDGC